MKTLWLIRHAKSSWAIEGQADIDRPLNERGYTDAYEMARRLKKKTGNCLIVTSPAIRAVSTALIFARNFGIDASEIQIREGLYESGPAQYASIISSFPDNHSEIMLFGHNPVISQTAELLTGTTIEEIPTAGIIGISFSEHSWKKAAAGSGKMAFYDFPKNQVSG